MTDSFMVDLDGFLADHEPVAKPSLCAIGSVVDGWRVVAFLGRGGNAEVYRVVPSGSNENNSSEVAALKVLVRDDAASRARFAQEVHLLSSRMSPSLPQLMSSGEVNGRPYLVVELLEPIDLPSTDSAVAAYLLSVCKAVSALHYSGLVHRDLKPANIMRRANGELVLIDLGLVKDTVRSFDPEKDVSFVAERVVAVGTPRFAAPEQLTGDVVTPAADIHALGRMADLAFDSNPPRCWAPIIRRATSSIPGQRYASVEDFSCAIRHRHRLQRMAIAAGILVVGILAISLFGRRVVEAIRWQMIQSGSGNEVQIRLQVGKTAFSYPLELEGGREYFVRGPGTLVADLRAATPVRVHLKNCFIFNSSSVSVDKANIHYVFDGGGYLNFTSLDEPPRSVLNSQIENFDLSDNEICFKGPMTSQGLERLRQERIQRQLDRDR